jgi:5-methylcytosine-specific restriction endonuclease McrA
VGEATLVTCPKCHEDFEPSEMRENPNECVTCRRAYHREYMRTRYHADEEFRARSRELNRQYKQRNREQCSARERARKAQKAGAFVEYVDPLVVLERDDGVCGICSADVDPLSFHVDHVVPIAWGGEHSYENTQPAHPFCNWSKGAR